MKITFYPRGKSLQVRISDGVRVNYRFCTGIKIDSHTPFVSGKFIGSSGQTNLLNSEVKRIGDELAHLYKEYKTFPEIRDRFRKYTPEEYESKSETALSNLLCKYVKAIASGEIKTKQGRRLSETSIYAYTNAASWMLRFAPIKDIDLMKYHLAADMDQRSKKEVSKEYQQYFTAFENFMISQDCVLTTRFNIMNVIATMVRYWESELFINLPTFNIPKAKVNPIVVLPETFMRKFLSDEHGFYKHLDKRMRYMYELCAMMMITTLRVDDAVTLKWRDFISDGDDLYLNKPNKKTGHMTTMPLPKFISKIIRDNMSKTGHIYSMPEKSGFNYKTMPRLFEMYPEMHELVTIRRFGLHGEEICETEPFYEAVHPHMLRKTAITTMIHHGVPERVVRGLSGHKSNAFERYVGFAHQRFSQAVNEFYDKFLT